VTATRKWILWSVLAIFLVVAGFVAWGIASIPGILKDCYGQWVSAELVIGFQEQHGRLPTSWQELEPIYGDGRGLHHGGLSFAQVQQRMVIEFPRLAELQTLAQTTTNAVSIPRVIYPKTGRRSHWQGAEPNQMIYEYFVEHRRPNTALEPTPTAP